MADNMIFPIGFDLEAGIKQAAKDWDGKYAAMLEKEIQKRALKVRLSFDTKNLDNLDAVKQRLAQLKIEPITADNKAAIKELVKELKEFAKAMEKVSKFKGIELPELQAAKAAKIRKETEQADEKLRLSQERVRISQERLTMAQQKAEQQAQRTGKAYNTQRSFLEGLLKRMATYWSIRQVGNFLTNVREVTAQFELQRVSLGAIIQDQNRANRLFSEIKTFALKSPVTILDLTKYTKQVAAYGIETEKLFDTTKRLADVSVGLGVDMGRITLAYGQVKAASYLRAAEIRQFTEAGIPMLELLAKKFTALNGEMVTTEQVMDMVSKRGVDFKMVEEIFNDMTSAGGMFYNMQEKQGNTLYGMWSKLGDAASMMYDEIGNTDAVAGGMRIMIQFATDLMKNWRAVKDTILAASLAFAGLGVYAKAISIGTAISMAKVKAATAERVQAQVKLNTALKEGTAAEIANARAALQTAKANEQAAISAQKSLTASQKLKSGLMSIGTSLLRGLGVGLVITAVTMLVYKLAEAWENAGKLKKELDNISAERITLTAQSIRNFEYLANAAVNAADGSKKQKDALDELHRTYKDMLPVEDLTIEKLRAMHGNYQQLTTAIREYIAEQQRQKAISVVEETYGAEITKQTKALYDSFKKAGFSERERERFFREFEKQADYTSKSVYQKFKDAMEKAGIDSKKYIESIGEGTRKESDLEILFAGLRKTGAISYIRELAEAQQEYRINLEAVNESYSEARGELGKYQESLERVENIFENGFIFKNGKGEILGEDTFLYQQGKKNFSIKAMIDEINKAKPELQKAGIELKEEWLKAISLDEKNPLNLSFINFDAIIEAVGDKLPQFKNFLQKIKKEYENLVPPESKVQLARDRFQQIALSIRDNMDGLDKYLMKGGDSWETYVKRLKDAVDKEKQKLKELRAERAKSAAWGLLLSPNGSVTTAQLENQEQLVKTLETAFKDFENFYSEDKWHKKVKKADPRLQTLKEEISLVQKLYKDYQDLEKQLGVVAAKEEMRKLYPKTFDNLAEKFKKYGAVFRDPFDSEALIADLEALRKHMEALPKKTFSTLAKDLEELDYTIEHVRLDKMSKEIEAKLKALAEKISRTKTAREFYDKVLSLTGDYDLATKISVSLYGDTGEGLQDAIIQQIEEVFKSGKEGVTIDLSAAIDYDTKRIDYTALRKLYDQYQDALIEKNKDTAKKLVEEGEKLSATQVQAWLKDLEKAKTYADKRVELELYTANKIAEIRASNLPQEQKDEFIKGYEERQTRELSKLQYDAFKDSPMYVHLFESLDSASTTMLTNMRKKLETLKTSLKGLDPTQLKEIQSRIKEIDDQLIARNPFKSLVKNIRELATSKSQAQLDANLIASTEALADAEERLAAATKEYNEAVHDRDVAADEVTQAKDNLQTLKDAGYAEDSPEVKEAQELLRLAIERYNVIANTSQDSISAAKENLSVAKENYKKSKDSADAAQEEENARKKIADKIKAAVAKMDEYQDKVNEALDGVKEMMEVFGASEEDMQFFDDITGGLNKVYDAGQSAASSAASFMTGDYLGGITSGISAISGLVSGFSDLFSAGKVRRANKEIKKQQELIDQLEESYSRLQSAADKLFGKDYISNFNTQMANLQAQQAGYLKQAEAERSKGKKADEDKIKEFEKSARETAQEIADLQAELVEHFTGTSRADAARQFAESWLEAKASFANTKDAILSEYQELIKNMIIEGAAAKVMDTLFAPMWEQMEEQLKSGDVEGAIDYVVNGMDEFAERADNAMNVLYKSLEAKGYDMQKILSSGSDESTGIARSVASATSEEINNVATIGNTLMYYVSPIPVISENVAAMRAYFMEGDADAAQGRAGYADLIALQNQSLENQRAIAQYTSEILAECRKTATHCESVATEMHRVVGAKNGKFAINTTLV